MGSLVRTTNFKKGNFMKTIQELLPLVLEAITERYLKYKRPRRSDEPRDNEVTINKRSPHDNK